MADFGGALRCSANVSGHSSSSCRPCRMSSARCGRSPRAGRAAAIVLGEAGEDRRFPRRARRLAASGTGDAGARARRRADGRRLQGLALRGAAQIPDQGPLDPPAEPHPRRARDPGDPAEGMRARQARRGAGGDRARRPGAIAQLAALPRLDRLMALPDGGAPSAHAARDVLETIAARRPPMNRRARTGHS